MKYSRRQNSMLWRNIVSFLKNNSGWVCFFAFTVIMIFYFAYWNSLVLKEENRIVSLAEEKARELVHNSDVAGLERFPVNRDKIDVCPWEMYIQQGVSVFPNVADVPDISNISHISKLKKLERNITYEEKLPQDVISHKKTQSKTQVAKVAVVVDDMGGSIKRTKEIIELKAPLTASFLTFAPRLTEQIKASRKSGHEIMIHVPMQPQSNIYVSEDVLKVDMTTEQIRDVFMKMLDKFDGIKGINNHMGSRFTEYGDKLAPVMKLLAERQLFFLDSKTTPKSQAEQAAEKYGVPYLHRHVFLDNNNDFDYIMNQLKITEKIALKNGYAIAICHPKTQTSKALKAWLNSLDNKKIKLVPLSVLMDFYS